MGARGRRKERRGERERERRDDGARAPGEPRPEPATSPSPAGSHIPGASRVGARTPRRPAGRRRSGRPPVEGAGEERDARPAPAGAVRPPRTTLAGLSLSLSARTGRARGGGGRAGPAGGQEWSRLPPHRRRGERPRRRGFPPPLAPRHPTGPRRRVPTAGESGRGRERERRSARGRSREEGRPAARRRRAGRTRPARTRGARANAGRRPRLNFGRRRAPGSGALRADSQPRDAIPPAAAKPQGGAAIDRQATLRQA